MRRVLSCLFSTAVLSGSFVAIVTLVGPGGAAHAQPSNTPGWSTVPIPTNNRTVTYNSISCSSSSFCVASSFEYSLDPILAYNGSTWSLVSDYGAAVPDSISCPTTTFCMTVAGDINQVAVYHPISPIQPTPTPDTTLGGYNAATNLNQCSSGDAVDCATGQPCNGDQSPG